MFSSRQDFFVVSTMWSLSKALLAHRVSIFTHSFTNCSHPATQSQAESNTYYANSNFELQGEVSYNQKDWSQELSYLL